MTIRFLAPAFWLFLGVAAASTPEAIFARTPWAAQHAAKIGMGRTGAPISQAVPDTQRLVMHSLDGEVVRAIPVLGEWSQVPMWSPDGKAIAFQVYQNGRNMIAVV